MKHQLSVLTALAATLLAVPAMADAPKGYFNIPGVDTAVQLYGNACFDVVNDSVQGGGVMTGLSGAGTATDNAAPKNQWDMTMDESRFGMRTITPSEYGDVKTRFELDFLGTNKDKQNAMPWGAPISGETTNYAHVRQMYGEWQGFLAGKTDSNFEDPDGSPNYLDWDGLLADWYGVGRINQLRYTANLNDKTALSFAIEQNNSNAVQGTNPNYPQGATINPGVKANTTFATPHSIPGSLTGRLQYADKWGHISFAGAVTKYEQFASQAYTAATDPVAGNAAQYIAAIPAYGAVAGSTATYSKTTFSWAIAGHFQFGDDSFVYHFGLGDGQYGAGLEDGVVWGKDNTLQNIQSTQFEAGYEHFWTPKVHTNLFYSYVGYQKDTNKGMDGAAFHTYNQIGANMLWNITKTMQYGVEYIYGEAKTFDSGTLTNPDGSTTDTVHENKLHFQFKYKFN